MRVWLVMFAALICFQFNAFGQELVPEDEPAAPEAPEKEAAEKEKAPEEKPEPQKEKPAEENVVAKPAAPAATLQVAPELKAKIEALVKQLSVEDWEKREEATKKLIEIGEAVIPAVATIRNSDDMEVKTRAERILAAFHWISPEDRTAVDKIVLEYEQHKKAKVEADIQKFAGQLGSEDGDIRKKAFDELVKTGKAALPELEKLSGSDNAQVKALAEDIIGKIGENEKKFRTEIIEKLKSIKLSEFYLVRKLAAGSTDADREALIAEVISGVMGLAYWNGPSNVMVRGNQLVIDGEAFPLPAGPWSIQEKGDSILVNGVEYSLPFKFVEGISTAEVLGRIVAMDKSGDELRAAVVDIIAKRKEKDAIKYVVRVLKPVEEGQTDTSLQRKILTALSGMFEDGPAIPTAEEGIDKLNESIRAWRKWLRKAGTSKSRGKARDN